MRFLVDESTGPAVAQWLAGMGYDATSIYEEMAGAPDSEVIKKAYDEKRVLITNDKDFGEKVFHKKHEHVGVILLRLENERGQNKIRILKHFLTKYKNQIQNNFIVVTESRVRISKT